MLPTRALKFCPKNPARNEMGRKNGGHRGEPAAHHRHVLARERGVQTQQGDAPLLDRGEVGHDLLKLVADVLGRRAGRLSQQG
jgi:hypothetical protein